MIGRLVRAPRKGSVVVIEFSDGMHEYVTTPVKRVLRLAGREVFYIETVNSRYRLEVRGREVALDGAASGGGGRSDKLVDFSKKPPFVNALVPEEDGSFLLPTNKGFFRVKEGEEPQRIRGTVSAKLGVAAMNARLAARTRTRMGELL